ncbi:MAG: hypothetical protein GY716_08745 [bacterium]|nr:hypothetical protein [bacterium]
MIYNRCLTLLVLLASMATVASAAVSIRGPVSIDVTDDGLWAAIAFQRDDSVSVVDLSGASPVVVADLGAANGIGRRPITVRCVGHTAIVLYEYDTKLSLIDLPTASIVDQIDVPMYAQDVVWDAAQDRYFVSSAAFDAVYAYDDQWLPLGPADGVATGRAPGPLAIGPNGRLYVGNRRSWDVSVLDVDDPDPLLWGEVARIFLGSRPEDLAATSTSVLVTHHGGAGLITQNGIPRITDDQTQIQNILTEIDPVTLSTTDHLVDQGADYAGIDVDSVRVAFAGSGSGTVHVAELASPATTLQTVDLLADGTLPGGDGPDGVRVFTNTRDVALHPSGSVFAVNYFRDTLVELREMAGMLVVFGETVLNPAGVPITAFETSSGAVNFNPLQQGERYLHTLAAWRRGQTDFTCATCHPNGDTDRRILDDTRLDPFGLPGQVQGPETIPSLAGLMQTAPFGWEGLAIPLFTFNALALNNHDASPSPGNEGIFPEVATAIERFETNIRPGPSPFPSNPAGRQVFANQGGCVLCHVPPVYTDNNFYNIGTARTVNIPQLIGSWNRGPFLHDGRASTVEALVDPTTYDLPHRHGHLPQLSSQQRRDVAAFVRSLGPDVCLEVVGNDIATGLRVGKAPCAATEASSTHHDFVRTTLDALVAAPAEIDLGQSLCLADEHEVRHLEEAADPGNLGDDLWVFLVRESGAGEDYGVSSAGLPRRTSFEDCPQ